MNHNNTAGSSNDAHSEHQHHNNDITPAALLEQLVYVDTFMPEIDDPTHLDDRLTAELAAFVGDSFVFPDEEKPKLPKQEDGDRNRLANLNNNNFHGSNNNNHNDNHTNNVGPNAFNANATGLNNTAFSMPTNRSLSETAPTNFSAGDLLMNSSTNLLSPLNYSTNNTLANPNVFQHQQQVSQVPTNGAPTDILSVLPKVPVPPGAKSSLIAAGLSTTQIDALAALIAQHENTKTQSAVTNLATNFQGQSSSSNAAAPTLRLRNSIGSSSSALNSLNSLDSSLLGTRGRSRSVSSSSSRNNSSVGLGDMPDLKVESTGDPELDKRKRNTAASARFRIKKKLKEQQLERSVRELTELTMTLEKKIQTLEMENRLLRNLVVEKGEQRNNNELEMLKQRAKMASDAGLGGSYTG